MSIKTFFEAIGSEFKKIFGKSATWEQSASSVIKYVAPLLETIVTLAAGSPAATIVTNIVNAIEADLATVSTVVQGAAVTAGSTTAATVKAALSSIDTNLSSILEDAAVKNSAKVTEITATTNLISGEVSAMLSNLPA